MTPPRTPTRAEFIERWRHELAGAVLDGATTARTGADLALFARQILRKVDAQLNQMYLDLTNEPAGTNGTVGPPVRPRQTTT
jgi:hypothetical protein